MTQHNFVLVANVPQTALDFVDVLMEEGEQLFFAEGSTVQERGEIPRGFQVILSGRVLLERYSASKAPAVLRVLSSGELFNVESIAFPDQPTVDTVIALDDTYTVTIRPHTMERIRHRVPRLENFAVCAAARDAADIQHCLVEATEATAEERVRARLLTLSEAYGGRIRLSQRALADLAGTTRPTVNRVLQQLQADGVLTVKRSRVEVLDPEGLVTDFSAPTSPPTDTFANRN